MAKIEDGKYEYSRFSKEDAKMYREILESLPYNPELEDFFLKQGKAERRLHNQTKRHIATIPLEDAEFFVQSISTEDEFLRKERNQALYDVLHVLTPLQKERISLVFFEGLSYQSIAEANSICRVSVKQSIDRALHHLKREMEANH